MDKKTIKKIMISGFIVFVSLFILVFILNLYVVLKTKDRIIDKKDFKKIGEVDCIIVLGGGIRKDKPSPLLQDRLDKAIEIYNLGLAHKIIMSGDHGKEKYNEVQVMKNYAINKGIPSSDIFMDHAGFSTYDTMYRAKEIFNVKKAIIVTQKYHLYRSLYIANHLKIDAYGIPAENIKRSGRIFREIREVLARNKDVFKTIIKPKSKYMGERIDITGDGDVTND